MNNIRKKFYALKNASAIQYYANVLDSNGENYVTYVHGHVVKTRFHERWCEPYYAIVCHDYEDGVNIPYLHEVPTQVAKFLLSGRTLKGGLATPMARYYAYRVLNGERVDTFEEKLWDSNRKACTMFEVPILSDDSDDSAIVLW